MISIELFNMFKNEEKINLAEVSEYDIINVINHKSTMISESCIQKEVIDLILKDDDNVQSRLALHANDKPDVYLTILDMAYYLDETRHNEYVSFIKKVTNAYKTAVPIVAEARINASNLSAELSRYVIESIRINRLIY